MKAAVDMTLDSCVWGEKTLKNALKHDRNCAEAVLDDTQCFFKTKSTINI